MYRDWNRLTSNCEPPFGVLRTAAWIRNLLKPVLNKHRAELANLFAPNLSPNGRQVSRLSIGHQNDRNVGENCHRREIPINLIKPIDRSLVARPGAHARIPA